ncbi:deoxyribodipyrimidine photolyase [Myxococcota bacterium]|nr:deoxyribodipyrimidine photolyase [Myxococcota bacterium]
MPRGKDSATPKRTERSGGEHGLVRTGRVRTMNAVDVRPERRFVLYWMIASRRTHDNFALDRAVEWARELGRPLVVLEPLRAGYPHASDRLHRFVLDGMRDNAAHLAARGVLYHPYVEPTPGAGRGLLEALAKDACVVVTDEWPCFFVPRMVAAAATKIDARLEAVDSNGLTPLAATDRVFTAANHFRSFVHKNLPTHLSAFPARDALTRLPSLDALPASVTKRWPAASAALLAGDGAALAALPIDHSVPVAPIPGGARAGEAALARFVSKRLDRYVETRNEPEVEGTSGLSPYLHFGHVSAHRVFTSVMEAEGWSIERMSPKAAGSREGFWGASPSTEAFLDQLLVWRELSFNTAAKRPDDYDRYSSLPAWALATLADHASDPRRTYSLEELEQGRTHDRLWNAAMGQMRRTGWFHNYMRMLWGKKILEWSPTPEEALKRMIHLMNKWSLDGRDPASYGGYFWILGRYDRPWPERAIFGKVRYMTSESTAKKYSVGKYIATWADPDPGTFRLT